ncbi:unnamed protein product [Mucor hiemalis]
MGVTVERISPGDEKNFPKKGDKVTIHYVGTLENVSFPITIGVGQVIKGWDEGVPQLSIGEKARLICTHDYAYGERGYPGLIPPRATLNFEVELLKIN